MFDVPLDQELEHLLSRIAQTLQLTETQHGLAVQHYQAVGTWLADDPNLRPLNPRVYPQGSFAIGTTVKPINSDEYDLDLVVEVDDGRYSAGDLYNAIYQRLNSNGRYKPEKKNRCLRLTYEHQFHMDILPGRPDGRPQQDQHAIWVPDRKLSEWKESNPRGYATWFEDMAVLPLTERTLAKADVAPAPDQIPFPFVLPLKRAIQIIKRWRDIRWENDSDMAPISVVLTTLAGNGYQKARTVTDAIDQILRYIIGSIPTTGRLIVLNPKNKHEDLSEKWDSAPGMYKEFVVGIHELWRQWQALKNLGGHKLYENMQGIFGVDLTNQVIKEQAAYVDSMRKNKTLGLTREGRITSASAVGSVATVARNRFWGR